MDEQLVTPAGVAERCDVSTATARSWMATGRVPGAFRHGASYLVTRRDLERAMGEGTVGEMGPQSNGSPFLTVPQVRRKLAEAGIGIARETVYKWLRWGYIPGKKAGKAWAIPADEFRAMLAAGFEVPTRGRPPSDAG